jgi:hypothetical protein
MALLNQVCALLVWAIALHSPVQPLSEFSAVCQPSSIRLAGWLNGCQPFSRAAFRQSDPLGRAQTGESDAQVQDDNVVTQGRCDRAGQVHVNSSRPTPRGEPQPKFAESRTMDTMRVL